MLQPIGERPQQRRSGRRAGLVEMAASNRPYANPVLPAWMWPSSAAAATAAAEDFERKKAVHEDTARQYRVAAGQLEQMTEGAMSEAMITEHQLLAVDHTNIARIDDEFAVTGRRLAEMAHSLSAHLDDIDYEAQQEISSSPPARRAAIITEAHAKAAVVLAAFTADVAGVRAQAEKEVGRLAAGIIGRAPTEKDPTTQALSNEPQHRGEKSGSSGQTDLHNAGEDAPGGSRSGQGDPHVRGDISDVTDGPAAVAVRHRVTHNSGVSCRAVQLRLGFRLRPRRAHRSRLR